MPNPKQNKVLEPTNPMNSLSPSYTEDVFENRKIYRCSLPDCGKTFKFKSEMNRHLAVHSDTRPYPCNFPGCGKTFKRADALSNHARVHNQTTPFTCTEEGCDAEFVTKSALRYHLLKHNGEKVYTCTQQGCNKSFMTQAQLKQHEKASVYHRKISSGGSPGEEGHGSYYSPESTVHNEEANEPEIPVNSYENLNDWTKPENNMMSFNINNYTGYDIRTKNVKEDSYDNFSYLEHIYGNNGTKQFHYNERVSTQIPDLNTIPIQNVNVNMKSANLGLYNIPGANINENVNFYGGMQQAKPTDMLNQNKQPQNIYTTNPNEFYYNNYPSVPQMQSKKENTNDFVPYMQPGEEFNGLYA